MGLRRAETAKIVPARPKTKQRSEKTRMGTRKRERAGIELGFWGLSGLEEYEVGREGEVER
jgi:hypothetical protein